MSTITRYRSRSRNGILAAALAAGLVLATPLAAGAHVGVSPDVAPPGEAAVLTFSFSHGCDESPTTALRITMPEGLASVSPTVDPAWDIAVERAENGLVSAVTYTAVTPVPVDLRGTATIAVRLDEDAPQTLAFPVVQECETGANEWVEIAEDGQDPHDLESPAPVVTVSADAGAASGAAHEQHDEASADPAETSDDSSALRSTTAVATVLGSLGVVAGIAALVMAVLAYRRAA
jgi:uncharacterized protein YcnI